MEFQQININNKETPLIVTHDGEFHADEVAAICLLKLVFPHFKIIRTRDPEIIKKADFVLDVGGIYDPKSRKFDHHQITYKGNMATAGMILEWMRENRHLDSRFANHIKNIFIKGIDMQDTGHYSPQRGIFTFSDVISYYNPPYPGATDEEYLEYFNKALKFTFYFLEKIKIRYIQNLKYKKKFDDVLKHLDEMPKNILIFDENIPWKEFIFNNKILKKILLIIFPVTKTKWILHTVPKSRNNPYSDRIKLPQAWAGLLEEEFKHVAGIEDAVFCHKQRFMAVFKNRDAALKAAFIAIAENEKLMNAR